MTDLIENNLPKVSIVCSNFNKELQLRFFIFSVFRQSYAGQIELVIVDDRSTDRSCEVARSFIPVIRNELPMPRVEVILHENLRNVGNCSSRNLAVGQARGDIIIVTDSDCLLSRNFVESYVKAYRDPEVGVVISNFGIELGDRSPLRTLECYENGSESISRDKKVQDPEEPSSFLNTVTRGFSIRRSLVTEKLFDELFSYTNSPETGFGWEDIEMGCRLYQRGLKFFYVPDAFTLHMSHESSVEPLIKARGSVKNFRKLHEKHPWLFKLKKEWSLGTYYKIKRMLQDAGDHKNKDTASLDSYFGVHKNIYNLSSFWIRKKKPFALKKRYAPGFIISGNDPSALRDATDFLMIHPFLSFVSQEGESFFSKKFDLGGDWYSEQFQLCKTFYKGLNSGEINQDYFSQPLVPLRIYTLFPKIKIILFYDHTKDLNGFDIGRWLKYFPRENIYIIPSVRFSSTPRSYFCRLQDFLRAPRFQFKTHDPSQRLPMEDRNPLLAFKPSEVIVYTAIFGDRDILRTPKKYPNVRYICFTDNPDLNSDIWEMIYVDVDSTHPRRQAKIFKILPHRYFEGAHFSLWVDGTHIPRVNPHDLVRTYLSDHPLALYKHHLRNCVYQEGEECIKQGLDSKEIIEEQLQRYRQSGYPEQKGLNTCTIILRKHSDPGVVKAMEDWWGEIEKFSMRDQISFNFIMHKNNLAFRTIVGNVYGNHYFNRYYHIGSPEFYNESLYFYSYKKMPFLRKSNAIFLYIDQTIGKIGLLIKRFSPGFYFLLKRYFF